MNTETEHAGRSSGPADTRALTRKVLVFSLIVYVGVPIVLVCFYASTNFYSRMEQWYAMNISLQSVDPARVAMDNPELDIKILNTLLSPALKAQGFAEKQHALWRANRDWAIREGDLEAFEITRDAAHVTILLKIDTTNNKGTHYREVRETARWERIGRSWYLAELQDVTVKEEFKAWPGIVLP